MGQNRNGEQIQRVVAAYNESNSKEGDGSLALLRCTLHRAAIDALHRLMISDEATSTGTTTTLLPTKLSLLGCTFGEEEAEEDGSSPAAMMAFVDNILSLIGVNLTAFTFGSSLDSTNNVLVDQGILQGALQTCPNLESLSLKSLNLSFPTNTREAFFQLVSRGVDSLSLECCSMDEDTWTGFAKALRLTPRLVSLALRHIEVTGDDDDIFGRLVSHVVENPGCRHLTSFILVSSHVTPKDLHALALLLNALEHLKVLTFKFSVKSMRPVAGTIGYADKQATRVLADAVASHPSLKRFLLNIGTSLKLDRKNNIVSLIFQKLLAVGSLSKLRKFGIQFLDRHNQDILNHAVADFGFPPKLESLSVWGLERTATSFTERHQLAKFQENTSLVELGVFNKLAPTRRDPLPRSIQTLLNRNKLLKRVSSKYLALKRLSMYSEHFASAWIPSVQVLGLIPDAMVAADGTLSAIFLFVSGTVDLVVSHNHPTNRGGCQAKRATV